VLILAKRTFAAFGTCPTDERHDMIKATTTSNISLIDTIAGAFQLLDVSSLSLNIIFSLAQRSRLN